MIVQWKNPRPVWALNKDLLIRNLTHPVSESIQGINEVGRPVLNNNKPFTVKWRTETIDADLFDQAQTIIGDVIDCPPELVETFVTKPLQEVWLFHVAPAEFPIGTPAPPPPPPIEDPEKVQAILEKYRQSLVTIEAVKGVGPVTAARIKAHFDA